MALSRMSRLFCFGSNEDDVRSDSAVPQKSDRSAH